MEGDFDRFNRDLGRKPDGQNHVSQMSGTRINYLDFMQYFTLTLLTIKLLIFK